MPELNASTDTHRIIPKVYSPDQPLLPEPQGLPIERLKRAIDLTVTIVKKQNPDFEEHMVDSVADIIFGPLRLPKDLLLRGGSTEQLEQKQDSARIQQALTLAIAHASGRKADPGFVSAIYEIVRTHREYSLAYRETALPTLWRGIYNELAIARALTREGKNGNCEVYLPDAAQDIAGIPEEQDEIAMLDMRGVDMIAVDRKKKVAFLIDAKGRRENDSVYAERVSLINLPAMHNPCLERVLDEIGGIDPNQIYKMVLQAPSARECFRSINLPKNPPIDKSTLLATVGSFVPHVEEMVRETVSHVVAPRPRAYSFN